MGLRFACWFLFIGGDGLYGVLSFAGRLLNSSGIGGYSVIARNVRKGNRAGIYGPVACGVPLARCRGVPVENPVLFVWLTSPLKACNPVLLPAEAQGIQQDGFKAVYCGDFLVIGNEHVLQHITEGIIIRKGEGDSDIGTPGKTVQGFQVVEVQNGGYRFPRFGVSVCDFLGLRGLWLVYVQPIIRVCVSGRFPACDGDGGIVNPGKLPGNAFPVSVNSDGGGCFCVLL